MGRSRVVIGDGHGASVMVLGGSGFLGTHIGAAAQTWGATVVIGTRTPHGADRKLRLLGGAAAAAEHLEYGNPRSLRTAVRRHRPQVVVNAAGATPTEQHGWEATHAGNVLPVLQLVAALSSMNERERPVVVSVGSQAEYGAAPSPWREGVLPRPVTTYGTAKAAATTILSGAVQSGHLRGCTVRLPIVFGPAQEPGMLIPSVIVNSLEGRTTVTTPGAQRRRFLFAPDAGRAVVQLAAALLASGTPPVVNGPGYEPEPVAAMLQRIKASADWRVSVDVGGISYREREDLDAWPDTSLFDELVPGFELTPIDEAMKDTLAWYRDHMRPGGGAGNVG